MKFLIAAQLPRRLARRLRQLGHDAVHTLELMLRNRTPDADLKEISLTEERIVVSKDSAFVDSFVLQGMPHKLLLISTGRIKNTDRELLFSQNLDWLLEAFEHHGFVEIDKAMVTFHT